MISGMMIVCGNRRAQLAWADVGFLRKTQAFLPLR